MVIDFSQFKSQGLVKNLFCYTSLFKKRIFDNTNLDIALLNASSLFLLVIFQELISSLFFSKIKK
jgi:hypothetical protein